MSHFIMTYIGMGLVSALHAIQEFTFWEHKTPTRQLFLIAVLMVLFWPIVLFLQNKMHD